MKLIILAVLVSIGSVQFKLEPLIVVPAMLLLSLLIVVYHVFVVYRIRLLVGREANEVSIRNPLTRLKNSWIGLREREAKRIIQRDIYKRRNSRFTSDPLPISINDFDWQYQTFPSAFSFLLPLNQQEEIKKRRRK